MGRDNSRELRRRSDGILPHRRQPVPWEKALPFRILSLDGGVSRESSRLQCSPFWNRSTFRREHRRLFRPDSRHFNRRDLWPSDWAQVLTATEMLETYLEEGHRVFPSKRRGFWGRGQAIGVSPVRPASPG